MVFGAQPPPFCVGQEAQREEEWESSAPRRLVLVPFQREGTWFSWEPCGFKESFWEVLAPGLAEGLGVRQACTHACKPPRAPTPATACAEGLVIGLPVHRIQEQQHGSDRPGALTGAATDSVTDQEMECARRRSTAQAGCALPQREVPRHEWLERGARRPPRGGRTRRAVCCFGRGVVSCYPRGAAGGTSRPGEASWLLCSQEWSRVNPTQAKLPAGITVRSLRCLTS